MTNQGATTAATPTSATAATASGSQPPALPGRPDSLNSVVNRTASNYSSYNNATNRFGSSPYGYGGYGGYNSYSSPYSRFGGGGYGSMYGGYGGIGGMYGPMGGMGGMYGPGMGGMPGDPNNPNSLTQSFSQSTQATFQLIESMVGAFGGFAQMLESTYMATHSSFFAMISVAEQFGQLRHTLGSVLGIFTLMRWIRTAIAKLTGRPPPASSKELTPTNFASFTGQNPDGSPVARPSKKPFIFFIVTVFGLPYLMSKLIRALARGQEEEERKRMEANPQMYGGQPLDPSKLDFCRVMYDFTPDTNADNVQGVDLAVKKGDLVAVLSKSDPMGNPSEWWRCRARDGRMGYLPSPYLEPIQRRAQPAQITSASQAGSPAGSRAQTMSGTGSGPGSRAATMADAKKPPPISGKPGDIGVESFQKSQFYS
ncbi:Peroxin 13, N-terminal region-domain-containing protein [Lineolata rhizophorae]|uniref:Peroxisomal membrane protein PEX13 n=1 Tax=Lineolata rhizophorae TaxID=578093 RepID=A0A6A6P742_9PEZI|nr:Peroxin 13, N-terminal region-domain-containing protein [Lineolata rhizophorae]